MITLTLGTGSLARYHCETVLVHSRNCQPRFVRPAPQGFKFARARCVIEQNYGISRQAVAHNRQQAVAPAQSRSRRTIANDELKIFRRLGERWVVPGELAVAAKRCCTNLNF